MLTETRDHEEIIERVAALDIGKAELMCCVRVRDDERRGKRLQEVQAYSTMTRSLLGMADHLRSLGVTRVVMEATSDYWKPAFYLLEAHGGRDVAGQRQGRQAPAGQAQDRQARLHPTAPTWSRLAPPRRTVGAGNLIHVTRTGDVR